MLDKPQDDGGTQSEDDSDHTIDATQSEDAETDHSLHVDDPVLPHRHSLKLIKDICTRWNSTFYMLQRCVLLQKHITHVLAESKYAHLVPSPEQWLAAEKLCALLKPFQLQQTSAGRKVSYFRMCFSIYFNACGWTAMYDATS